MNPGPISKGPPSQSTGQAAGSAAKTSMAEARDRASAMLFVLLVLRLLKPGETMEGTALTRQGDC